MIFLWFCFLFPFGNYMLYVCDFATFSYLDIILLWFCYLFSFGYFIAVILLPFLISILYCCDFATFSPLDIIYFSEKVAKCIIWYDFWLNFWLNPLRVSPLIGGRWVFRFLLFGGPYRGKFLEANSKRHCGPWRVCVGWCSPTGAPLPYPAQVTVERWRVPNSKAS